jgi:hypothetical protein
MTERITSPQKKRVSNLLEEVLEELGLSKEDGQRLLSKGGVFKTKLKSIIPDLSRDKFPSQIHAPECIPEGWTVVEDVEPFGHPSGFTPKRFLRSTDRGEGVPIEDGRIDGPMLRYRAVELRANKGLSDAKHMLKGHLWVQTYLRSYRLVFIGTVLRNQNDFLYVPCLRWWNDHWELEFEQLTHAWGGNDRLVEIGPGAF